MARPQRDSKGQIQRDTGSNGSDLARFLANELAPQIRIALPKHLDGERMARVALTALRTTPKLALCDRWSFAACILQAAQLGLEVNTPLGHAYLIPREMQVPGQPKGVRALMCTLQMGYQGMIDLARRSGQVSTIYAFTVHDGDDFDFELGLEPKLRHVPKAEEQNERNMRFVYAVASLKGTEHDKQFVVLTKRQVEERKARGQGGPAWRTDFLAMARKTAVRALFTWLPKSPEMARVTVIDDSETTGKALPAVLDTAVIEQLDAMALPAPAEDDGADAPPPVDDFDPETGEVPPGAEPTDEQLGLPTKE